MSAAFMPRKPYYRIGEAARALGVETHVLRYWESEFPQIQPVRAPSGQRLYHSKHLDTLLLIKELLYNKGYTIAGAKKALAALALPEEPEAMQPEAQAPPLSARPPYARLAQPAVTPAAQQVNKVRPPEYIPPMEGKVLPPVSSPAEAAPPPYPPANARSAPPASQQQPAPNQDAVNATSLRQELEDLLAMLK
jgi:DNA-binding transcriptional MerR regulator